MRGLERNETFDCPYCRKETVLPAEGVVGFPVNFYLANQDDILEENKIGMVCTVCKQKPMTNFCVECEMDLCEDCSSSHGHSGLPQDIGQATNELGEGAIGGKESSAFKPGHCEQHGAYKIVMYCSDCQEGVCVTCVNDDHRGHTMADPDAFSLKRSSETISYLKGQVTLSLEVEDELKKYLTDTQRQADKVRALIHAQADSLCKQIHEEAELLDAQVHEEYESEKVSISAKMQNNNLLRKRHQAFLKRVCELRKNKPSLEALQGLKDMDKEIQDISSEKIHRCEKLLKWQYGSRSLDYAEKLLGKVKTSYQQVAGVELAPKIGPESSQMPTSTMKSSRQMEAALSSKSEAPEMKTCEQKQVAVSSKSEETPTSMRKTPKQKVAALSTEPTMKTPEQKDTALTQNTLFRDATLRENNDLICLYETEHALVRLYSEHGELMREFSPTENCEVNNLIELPNGNIAISYRIDQDIKVFSMESGSHCYTIAVDQGNPTGMAVLSDGAFVACYPDQRCVKIFSTYKDSCRYCRLIKEFRMEDDSGQQVHRLQRPLKVEAYGEGGLVVLDVGCNAVYALSHREGRYVCQWHFVGEECVEAVKPIDLAVDRHGNVIIADHLNNRVILVSNSGSFMKELLTSLDFDKPISVSVNHDLLSVREESGIIRLFYYKLLSSIN